MKCYALLLALCALTFAQSEGSSTDAADATVGSCQEVQPGQLARSQCRAVVNYPVYVPGGVTIEDMDAAAAAATGPVLLGLVGPQCAEPLMAFACVSAFRPCQEITVEPFAISLPRPVCRDTCDRYVEKCSGEVVLAATPGALPDCTAEDPQSMQLVYPEHMMMMPVAGEMIPMECAVTEAAVRAPYSAIPAGRCEPMQETVFSQCSHIIDYPVFVPRGHTQRDLDFSTYNSSFPLLWAFNTEECSAAAFRFSCTSGFPACDEYELAPGVVLSLPRGPCASVCQEFNYFCEEPLTSGEEDNRVPCAAALPPDELVVPVSADLVLTANCVVPPYNVTLDRQCSPLTAFDYDGDCVLQCPNPMFSDEQWTVWVVVISVFAWLAIVSSCCIMCNFAIHPLKRQYPRSNAAWQIFYLMPLNIYYASYSLAGGIKNATCGGTDAPTQLEDTAWCAYSFIFNAGGAWMGLIWYVWVGLSLLLVITNHSPNAICAQVFYHSTPIIFTAIWMAIVLGLKLVTNGGLGPCAIENNWHDWMSDILFWIPWTMLLIIAVALLFSVFAYTVFVMGMSGAKSHWRIMAYLGVGLLSITYASTYHWEVRIEEDEIGRALEGWVACAATNLDWERCQPERLLVFPPFLIAGIAPLIVAPLIAVILLSDPIFTQYYSYLVRRYILRQDVPYPFDALARAEKISTALKQAGQSSSGGGTRSDF